MVKLVLLFKHPEDVDRFEKIYNRNLNLLEKMPGIKRRQANTVLGGPMGKTPYYRILEFYFEDFKALDAAMTSLEGQVAGQQLVNTVGNLVELLFVDVFEDNTPLN